MKKKRAMKEQPEVPLEMRRVLMDAFESVGGQQKFDAWAKRHPTLLYSMLMKLVPSMAQVAASVDTHVTVHVTEEQAKQKLISAFNALIEAERNDERTTIDARPATQGDPTYTRVDDDAARGTGHGAADQAPPSRDDGSAAQNKNLNHPRTKGSPFDGGPRRLDSTPAHVQPISNESTTDLYFRWLEGPGGAGRRWGPI
jgi:hypothetical protein